MGNGLMGVSMSCGLMGWVMRNGQSNYEFCTSGQRSWKRNRCSRIVQGQNGQIADMDLPEDTERSL